PSSPPPSSPSPRGRPRPSRPCRRRPSPAPPPSTHAWTPRCRRPSRCRRRPPPRCRVLLRPHCRCSSSLPRGHGRGRRARRRNVARRAAPARGSELAVIAFLEGIEQVGRGVDLPVVLDFLVALELHRAAVLELEAVGGVG